MALSKVDVECGGTGLVAAGTSGNVLTSDGTDWTSAAAADELPAAGSSGNVLTSDGTDWTSAAAAGGGAWELVSSVTASNVSSVEFTGMTSNNYAVVMSKVQPQNDSAQLWSRFGDSSIYTSGYAYHLSECSSTSNTYYAQSSNNTDKMNVCPNMGNEAKEAYSATIYLHGMNEANTTPRQTGTYTAGMDGGNEISGFIGGSRIHQGNTSPATQLWRIYYSSGNIASGRVSLYTIKNS